MLQHGVPRVSGIARDKTAAAKEKERRQIEQYQALETEVRQRVCTNPHATSKTLRSSKGEMV